MHLCTDIVLVYNIGKHFWGQPGIQDRTSWLTRKPKKYKTRYRNRTKKPENVLEQNQNRISVSENSWFRQEDFGFVCSLRAMLLQPI